MDSRDSSYEHIGYVLTLSNSDPKWKGALKNKIKCLIVEISDLQTEDLLTKLPQCVGYVNEAVVSEKSILVHW